MRFRFVDDQANVAWYESRTVSSLSSQRTHLGICVTKRTESHVHVNRLYETLVRKPTSCGYFIEIAFDVVLLVQLNTLDLAVST
jgi:hypothetical protein